MSVRGSIMAVTLLLPATTSWAQAQEYERREIVNADEEGVDPDEVPLPFEVPRPGAGQYRDLATLDGILAAPDEVGVLTQVELGQTRRDASGGGNVPARNVVGVEVSAAAPRRRDGTEKGRAVVLGGIHAREWMAYEAVVRRLQVFQSEDFADTLNNTVERVSPGTRDVFFVENVRALFVPLLNRGAIEVTHDHFDQCFMISEDDPDSPGDIRDGRLRRKIDGDPLARDASGVDMGSVRLRVNEVDVPPTRWRTAEVAGSSHAVGRRFVLDVPRDLITSGANVLAVEARDVAGNPLAPGNTELEYSFPGLFPTPTTTTTTAETSGDEGS